MKRIMTILATTLFVVACATTAFAANKGWYLSAESEWKFADNDGNDVTETFKKSGDNWYYLGEDGKMVTSKIFEHDGNWYAASENGLMITNQWIDNQDIVGSEKEANWMYFQNTGKAVEKGWKDIGGKKYHFTDFIMDYGFLDADGAMLTEEDSWQTAVYYCGPASDGAQTKNAWVKIDTSLDDYSDGFVWLYFGANGKKYADCTKTINGKSYAFDEKGAMKVEWTVATASSATSATASIVKYYKEDGTLVKKGWIWAMAEDIDDEENHWFYADGKGELVKGCVKTINGKKYAFSEYGIMLTGFVEVDETGKEVKSTKAYSAEDVTFAQATGAGLGDYYMYFTESANKDEQGAAYTGKQKVVINDATITVNFSNRGVAKSSAGLVVNKKNYAYINDVLFAREDAADKYEVIGPVSDTTLNVHTEDGKYYVLTTKTGKIAQKGTFTDNDNDKRIVAKDGYIWFETKVDGKWVKMIGPEYPIN